MLCRIPQEYHAIDMHNHVWLSGPALEKSSGAEGLDTAYCDGVIANADRYGIEKLAVSCPITLPDVTPEKMRYVNDAVLEAVRRYPDRLFGFCFVDAAFATESVAEIERCAAAGMKGIKLYHQHTLDDEIQRPVMECAARLGLPVLMHSGKVRDMQNFQSQKNISHAEHFLNALEKFPETIFIHAHIGGGGDWEWTLRVLSGLRNPRYFIDISGSVCDAEIVRRTIDGVGLESVLFATDMSFAESTAKVLNSGLSGTELQKILHDNWMKIEGMRK